MRESLKNIDNFRKLLEHISDGIIALDNDWNIVYVNQTAGKILHCHPDTLVEKNIWQVFPHSVENVFYKAYHEAVKTQKSCSTEGYSKVAGSWVKTFIYPSAFGVVIYFKDINAEKTAEARAEKSEKNYRLFLDRITDGFIALDNDFRYVYVNEKIGEMVHKDPKSLIGKNIWEEFPEAIDSLTYKAFLTAFKEQRFISNIDYYEPLQLWQENYIYPSPEGLSIIIKDVTDRKKLEKELHDQQRKQQFEIMMTAIEAQEKERTFIAQELHDNVNQLLAATKLMLSLARDNFGNREELLFKSIENIEKSIEENRRISHELITPDLEEQNLIEQLRELMQTMLSSSGIEIFIDDSDFDEKVLDDARKLTVYRIAQEQCNNIIKYAKAGKVNLILSNSGNTFTMIIEDDGIGTDELKENTSGIGLRNINARVSSFEGSFHITTTPGKGFKLEINIPVFTIHSELR